jgi:hypothetical protein
MTLDTYPEGVPEAYRVPPEVFESEVPFPRFINNSIILGLDSFTGAGGVIIDDFDNDEHLDVFSCSWDPAEGVAQIFWNDGEGRFTDGTREAGLERMLGGLHTVQGDYDNDGLLDIFILRGAWQGLSGKHPNSLLRNNGDRTFTDVTIEAGLAEYGFPTQAGAFADYDNDGDLDLFIGNESLSPQVNAPNQLFRNEGDGTFVDVAQAAGVADWGFSKGVAWGDYDNDGLQDIYVSNRFSANHMYHNNGDGTFTDVAKELGVDEPKQSFPVWFWDFDNDGNLDLYVMSRVGGPQGLQSHLASVLGLPFKTSDEHSRLYRGDGSGGFEEVSQQSGLTIHGYPMGANYGDIDNDGFLDIYEGTGFAIYEALIPNRMYRNAGGERFEDVTFAGGFGHLQKGHGISIADLDNDGDQDVFHQLGGAYPGDYYSDAMFENPGHGNHWLTLRLVGVQSNRSAIGARVRCGIVEDGKQRILHRSVDTGGSFGSNPLRQQLGLGQAERIEFLEVYWPATGLTQRFEGVPLDRFVVVTEDQDHLKVLDL